MILWVFIEFFGVKIGIIDIYRYLPIFYSYFFRNSSTSARAPQSRFFGGKIGDFTEFFLNFPQIDFSSAFSSRCRPKTDFSGIYRSKKTIFCSLPVSQHIYIFFNFFFTKDHIVDLGDEYNLKTKFSSYINIYVDDGQQENKYGARSV